MPKHTGEHVAERVLLVAHFRFDSASDHYNAAAKDKGTLVVQHVPHATDPVRSTLKLTIYPKVWYSKFVDGSPVPPSPGAAVSGTAPPEAGPKTRRWFETKNLIKLLFYDKRATLFPVLAIDCMPNSRLRASSLNRMELDELPISSGNLKYQSYQLRKQIRGLCWNAKAQFPLLENGLDFGGFLSAAHQRADDETPRILWNARYFDHIRLGRKVGGIKDDDEDDGDYEDSDDNYYNASFEKITQQKNIYNDDDDDSGFYISYKNLYRRKILAETAWRTVRGTVDTPPDKWKRDWELSSLDNGSSQNLIREIFSAHPAGLKLVGTLAKGPAAKRHPNWTDASDPVTTYEVQASIAGKISSEHLLTNSAPLDFALTKRSKDPDKTLQVILRQPPFWCCEPTGDPLRFIVAVQSNLPDLFVAAWNRQTYRLRDSISSVRADRPISMFPKLEFNGAFNSCAVFGAEIGVGKTELHHPRLWPANVQDVVDSKIAPKSFTGTASLPLFVDDLSGKEIAFAFDMSAPGDFDSLRHVAGLKGIVTKVENKQLDFIDVLFRQKQKGPGEQDKSSTFRLGSHRATLSFYRDLLKDPQDKRIRVWFPSLSCKRPEVFDTSVECDVIHTKVDYDLDIEDFSPAAQDLLPDDVEALSGPVLVDLGVRESSGEAGGGGTQAIRPFLSISESSGKNEAQDLQSREGRRHRLSLGLNSQNQVVPARDLIVLDTAPFFVAKVEVPALVPTAEGAQLAQWDSDGSEGPYWRVKAQRGGYKMLLPPQGMGESMLKRPDPTPVANRLADFRFSPNAELELFTGWRQSLAGIVEPPFNTRRLFGFATQRAPGAPVKSAKFELLYGMGTELRGESERLFTELTADLGFLPSPIPPDFELGWIPEHKSLKSWEKPGASSATGAPSGFTPGQVKELNLFKTYWVAVHRAFAQRLAVIMIQDKISGVSKPFTKNINFGLRKSAQIREPVVPKDGTAAPYTKKGNGFERNGIASDLLLDGGADWGFESAEIYDEVWREPKSTSGEASNLHLSALGGWGHQRAVFADKSAIINTTAQGRTHFYSIERIGRIGVFWNRAKHVIVYERAVIPSDQFFGHQPNEEGRPFLRKVREYVEILQPERRFPENGEVPVRRGCIEGIVFRTKIIPVDSDWGQDIPNTGWKVPLWNPRTDRPDVYPKPQIELRITADPTASGSATPHHVAIDEPQNLVFFTSTLSKDRGDTDVWDAVNTIDYVAAPLPTRPNLDSHHAGDPDMPLPSDKRIAPGFEPVTFVLDRQQGRLANLSTARDEKNSVSAMLEAVTLMRPPPRGAKADDGTGKTAVADIQLVREARDKATKLFDTLRVIGADDDQKRLADLKAKFTDAFPQGLSTLKKLSTAQDAAGKFEEAVRGEFQGALSRVRDGLASSQNAIALKAGEALYRELGRVDDTKNAFNSALHDANEELCRLLKSVSSPLERMHGALKKPLDVSAVTKPLELELDRLIERVKAKHDVAALEADLKAKKQTIISAFDRLVIDTLAPVRAAVPAVADALEKELVAPRAALVAALESFEKAVGAVKNEHLKVIAELEKQKAALKDAVTAAAKKVTDALAAQVSGTLGEFVKDFTDKRKKMAIALNLELATVELRKELEKRLTDLKQKYGTGNVQDLKQEAESIVASFMTNVADETVRATIKTFEDGVNTLFGEKLVPYREAIKEKLNGTLRGIRELDLDPGALFDKLFPGDQSLRQRISEFEDGLRSYEAELISQSAEALKKLNPFPAGGTEVDAALRLVRAFGDAPIVPGMNFNRKQIAYIFNETLPHVECTPVTALVDRVGSELKALGMRVPFDGISGQLLPKLENFKISALFPDIAGLKLDNLFPSLFAPNGAGEQITVKHGIDKQTQRAWLDAEVRPIAVGADAPLFSFAGLAVTLMDGKFSGKARLETDTNGAMERDASGQIAGSWQLAFGGKEIVTFKDTPLTFDKAGQMNFALKPTNIHLSPELTFLDQFLEQGSGKGGLKVGVLQEGLVPTGVECLLDIPIPPYQAGTFGVTGLRLITGLQLRAGGEFSITAHAALGAQLEPFTITIFILGGSGWVQVWGRYHPQNGRLTSSASIAIGASATLGFSAGPINGIVQLFVGVKGEMQSTAGQGSLSMSVIMLARGQVDVAGLITASLALMLEVRMTKQTVTGHGTALFSIRMGPFYTWRIAQAVTYELVKGDKADDDSQERAQDYAQSLA